MNEERQNYNMAYLSGMDVNDMEYVESFNMPHRLAHTPQINDFMLDRVYEDNVEEFSKTLSEADAKTKALGIKNRKRQEIDGLLAAQGLLTDGK